MQEPEADDSGHASSPAAGGNTEPNKTAGPESAAIIELVDAKLGQFLAVLGQAAGQILSGQSVLQSELKNLQSAGPQRVMFGMYRKLFVELLQHMNQLDSLVELGRTGDRTEAERAWIESLEVARDGLESVLAGWGVHPMEVQVNEDEFDPDRHEGVASTADSGSVRENVIVGVHRRGWMLNEVIIQYPQVSVS